MRRGLVDAVGVFLAGSHQRYGYAKPTLKSCIGILASSDYSDAMLACACNLDSNQVATLRFQTREMLREDCPCVARRDLIGKKGEVLCVRGQTPQMYMIHGSNEHELEFNDVREAFMENPMYAHLCGPMSREQKQAELRIKDSDRCVIAPYAVRLALLDHLIASTAIDMKQHPSRRTIETDSEIKFRAAWINECRYEKGKNVSIEETDNEEMPRPPGIKRSLPKPLLKDGHLTVHIPGKKKKTLMLTSLCSISRAPATGDDILWSDIELGRVWVLINQKSAGSWLVWTYNNDEFAINNDDRFRHMVKTQRDIAYEARDSDANPTYELTLRQGMPPEDQPEWDAIMSSSSP